MKKKKRRTFTYEETQEAKKGLRDYAKKINKKLVFGMLAELTVLALVYYILIDLQVIWATPVLYTAAAVLFLTFFLINRGFSRYPVTAEELPDSLSPAEKEAYIQEDTERKSVGRILMAVMVPVLLLVMADIVYTVILN